MFLPAIVDGGATSIASIKFDWNGILNSASYNIYRRTDSPKVRYQRTVTGERGHSFKYTVTATERRYLTEQFTDAPLGYPFEWAHDILSCESFHIVSYSVQIVRKIGAAKISTIGLINPL